MLPSPDDFMAWLRAIGEAGWITTPEAAELLRMTPGRLCLLRRQGRTPPNLAAKTDRRHLLWAYLGVTEWAAARTPGPTQ